MELQQSTNGTSTKISNRDRVLQMMSQHGMDISSKQVAEALGLPVKSVQTAMWAVRTNNGKNLKTAKGKTKRAQASKAPFVHPKSAAATLLGSTSIENVSERRFLAMAQLIGLGHAEAALRSLRARLNEEAGVSP